MATGAFERLAQSVLRHLGQDAFLLRGVTATPTRVNIERGVQVMGSHDDATFIRDIATLPSTLAPRVTDAVRIGTTEYVLDGLLADNGYLARFTIQQT